MYAKLTQLFVSSRPISWVNTGYPFAAGYLVTIRHVDWTFIVGSLFFLIPYNVMMYGVNDVFDYESDLRNPRKGGIEGALLKKANHGFILRSVIILNLPFIVFLLLKSTSLGIILFLLDIGFVLAYSLPKLRFKERPFLDSLTSSLHFSGPLIYAFSFTHYRLNYVLIIGAFIAWGMASHAFGAVQDIKSDRAAKIGSVGTVIGAKATVRIALGLYGICVLLLCFRGWLGIICAVTTLLYAVNIIPFWNLTDALSESANAGWKRFLKLNYFSGFIVTLVLIYIYRQ